VMGRRGYDSSPPRDSADSGATRAESFRVVFDNFGSSQGLGRDSEGTRGRLGNDSGLCKTRGKTRVGTRVETRAGLGLLPTVLPDDLHELLCLRLLIRVNYDCIDKFVRTHT